MKRNNIKIAITGASGFIGSELTSNLINDPRISSVFALYESDTFIPSYSEKLIPIVGDLENKNVCEELLKEAEIVIHLAWRGYPSDPIEESFSLIAPNVTYTNNILESMLHSNCKKIIFASSGGALYKMQQISAAPYNESSQTEIRNPYALSKLCSEGLILLYQKLFNIRPVILRISNPYGIGQFGRIRQGFFGVAFAKLLKDEPMNIWGSLDICKDFLSLKDVISAFNHFIFSHYALSGIFNLGSGEGTTLRQGVELIEKITGKKLKFEIAPPKSTDTSWTVLDINKIKKATGWHPVIKLEDGLRDMWEETKKIHKKSKVA